MENSFSSLKPRLIEALNIKFAIDANFPGERTGFTLLDGFVVHSVQDQPTGLTLGGTSVPLVMVVGNSTGRAYFFSLKRLLPYLNI